MLSPQKQLDKALVGDSAAMKRVREQVDLFSRSRDPVLILGETGTGKECVARSIYNQNPTGALVVVDCSTLSPALIESELFGHVRGAFTGATNSKMGLLEAANGGVVFFDEIGELPLEIQSRLLRVLQEQEIRLVGALQTRKLTFRIMAATNRDLHKEVLNGRFRQDLYYRLDVLKLRIPPLRERREDIPELIRHFLALRSARKELTPDVLNALQQYDWPGNVRQLENQLARISTQSADTAIRMSVLPESVFGFQPSLIRLSEQITKLSQVRHEREPKQIRPLADIERDAIFEALEYCEGDRTSAAGLLKIGRTTLYRKLSSFGIGTLSR